MLNIRSLGIVLCYSATLTALVYNVPSSTIKEVTIGGNIAEVSRSFELRNVPNGFHTIVLNHLPDGNTADEKSIQVTGLGAAEVISTVTQNQVVHRENDPEFIALNAQLDGVRKALTAGVNGLDLERNKATKRLASLDTYIQDVLSANAAKSAPLSLDKLSDTLDYQEKALEQHNDKIASLDQKLTSAQACLSTLQAMVDTLREYGYYKNTFSSIPNIPASYEKEIRSLPDTERTWELTTQTKELHININVPATESKLVFNVEYMTSPAAWHAEYDIRLDTPTPAPTTTTTTTTTTSATPAEYEMRIGLYASVAQSTHEDWNNVHLHLSTSEPEATIYPPSPPNRQALHYQQDVPENMFQSISSGRPMHSMHKRSFSEDGSISAGSSARGGEVLLASYTAPEMAMADMTVSEVDMTGQSGTLGSTVTFSPPHTVNITSNHRTTQNTHQMRNTQYAQNVVRPAPPLPRNSAASRSTRLFIKEVVVAPRVFTYAVPTTNAAGAHLKAWAPKFVETGKDSTTTTTMMPLLQSPHGRIFLSSTYTGTTTVPATLPHTPLRLNLGSDRNVHITSTYVLPRQGSQSEEKVGWFVNDKVKYKVEVVEYAFTVHSTHTAPHLVVMSEYLPHVSEEGIKVELVQPAMEATVQLGDKSSANQDVWSEEDFVAAVLAHPSMTKPDASGDDKMHVFLSKGSNNIVYAKWVQPNQTIKTGLKYRIIWPDGKNIDKQVHY